MNIVYHPQNFNQSEIPGKGVGRWRAGSSRSGLLCFILCTGVFLPSFLVVVKQSSSTKQLRGKVFQSFGRTSSMSCASAKKTGYGENYVNQNNVNSEILIYGLDER